MDVTKLKELLDLAVQYGVTKLKTSDIEVELGKQVMPQPMETSSNPVNPKQELSDEDMLYWSVPQMDVFRQKQAAQEISPLPEPITTATINK